MSTVTREPATFDLAIGGMTCASCATRVEKRLNRIPGVEASVNLATERAHVVLPEELTVEDAIHAVEASGYSARVLVPDSPPVEGDRGLGTRLAVSAALALPVVLLSMIPALRFDGWTWVALALTVPVVTWAAWPLHVAGWRAMLHASPSMDSLVSLGVIASFGWSLFALALDLGETYLEVATVVTSLVLLGRVLEQRAKRSSGDALRSLLDLAAKDVELIDQDGGTRRAPAADLRVGDRFLVRPGERVATDGEVVDGASAIDASLVTGEPVPVDVTVGDAVVGATVNTTGVLVVRATRVGSQTQLARIAALVEAAQTGKAPIQRLADRVSAVFVPVVVGLSLITLAGWLIAGADPATAFAAAVSVLIIACPCALGLATPAALLAGTGRGAQLGLLIRGHEVLESTRRIDTVVLDKTGTLTTGVMRLDDVIACEATELEVLTSAAAVERGSEHPIARAVTAAAAASGSGTSAPVPVQFVAVPGRGARAVLASGTPVSVGRPEWLTADLGLVEPEELRTARAAWSASGGTVVAVGWDGAVRGVLHVTDTIKPTSGPAVERLHGLGLRVVLLTGDAQGAADDVARRLGIDEATGAVLPEGKIAAVRALQQQGKVVAFVGDGVNDAAALSQADLGIAMGTGADIAMEASDLTIMRGDPLAVVDAIALSRRTLRTIRGNLAWAFGYNVAAIPLAMAGLLNPMLAAGAMAFSSVFVLSNSLRLRGFRPAR